MRGIVTVLNTPFTRDNAIDLSAVQANVALALDAGVVGFLTPAMAGEVGCLDDAERERLVSLVLETVSGAAVVIGGASASTHEERLVWTRRLTALGCDGVLVSVPWRDAARYEAEIRDLAECAPPFLMVQDWDPDGDGAPVSELIRLFEDIPCFGCVKVEVRESGPKYTALLHDSGGRLHVSGGWGVARMIDGLDRGVHAFMPTGMHRVYTRIFALHRAHRRDDAVALFERVRPILAYSNQGLELSIRFFKRLALMRGLYTTDRIRVQQPDLTAEQREREEVVLALAMALEAEMEEAGTFAVIDE